MNQVKALFYIARKNGLEFVFTSGRALRYPMHTHLSVYTVTVVRKGTVRLFRKNSQEAYTEGQTYIVLPHEPHRPEYEHGFDIVSLCMAKTLFDTFDHPSLMALCLRFTQAFGADGMLCAEDEKALLPAVAEACRIHGTVSREGIHDGHEEDAFAATLDCRRGEGPYRYIRWFKKEVGLTPHQYELQNRVRKAKQLLAAAAPIAEAALEAGFYDQSHLNRHFGHRIGITPRRYVESCFFVDE